MRLTHIVLGLLILFMSNVALARGPTVVEETTSDNTILSAPFDSETDANPATWNSYGATSNLVSMDLQGSATTRLQQTQHRSTVELTAADVASQSTVNLLSPSLYNINDVYIGSNVNDLTENDNWLIENTSLNNRNRNENSLPLLFISKPPADSAYSLSADAC